VKKTAVLLMIFFLLISPVAYCATSAKIDPTPTVQVSSDKMGTIQKKIQERLDQISRGGKPDQAGEKEITIDRYKKKTTATPAVEPESAAPAGYDMGTLASMNIIGGLFEGGIIGASCGLIGYSKSMNRDVKPLVSGTVAGMFTGMGLGAVLSLYQTTSKRYSASDDYGYDLAGGTVLGAMVGIAGGFISYGKTRHLENVSEGIGYGVAFGAGLGLILGTLESFLPEQYRGMTGKLRAMNLQEIDGSTVVSCNLNF
jgi:hypothetical protein